MREVPRRTARCPDSKSAESIGLPLTLLIMARFAPAARRTLLKSGRRRLRPWRRRRLGPCDGRGDLRLGNGSSRGRRSLSIVTTARAGIARRGTLAHAFENMRSLFNIRARLHRRGSYQWSAWQRALFANDTIWRIRPIVCGIGVRPHGYAARFGAARIRCSRLAGRVARIRLGRRNANIGMIAIRSAESDIVVRTCVVKTTIVVEARSHTIRPMGA